MKLKKYMIACSMVITIIFPLKSYAQNWGDNISCLGCCLLVPAYIVTSWGEGIGHLIDEISDSRTVSIRVNGVKCVFRRNSAVYNKNRKDKILSGEIVEKAEVIIRGKKLRILPGYVSFNENGNIARCLISPSELYTGDNAIVRCCDSVEFYDDEFVKSTVLDEDSNEDAGLFTILNKVRKLSGRIGFYNNGKVEKCNLKGDDTFTIGNYTANINGGTTLYFSEKENVVSIIPPYGKNVNLKYKDNFLRLSSEIYLHENGRLRYCILEESLIIQNSQNKLRVKGRITFYDNEMVEECRIINPVSIAVNNNTIEFDKSDSEKLSFYKNGNVKEGKITNNKKQYYTHHGNRLRMDDGSLVKFYEDGSLKSLVPYENTVLNISKDRFLLYPDSIRFYKDGGILSLYSARGTEYNYQGIMLYVNHYSDQLFFNRKQELIIFNNDNGQYLQINGESVFFPAYVKVSYSDYIKKTVDYVSIVYSCMTLPPYVKIADTEYIEYADIFVKAKNFFTNENKDKLYAGDIQEIMFSEDTMITVHGNEHLCKAMEWFKIPVN